MCFISPETTTARTAVAEHVSIGLANSFAGGQAYIGEDTGISNDEDVEVLAYSVKHNALGLMVAFEGGEQKQTSRTEDTADYTSAALTYTMGDLGFAFESLDVETDGSTGTIGSGKADNVSDTDENIYSEIYSVGVGLKVYAEASDDDKATTDVDQTVLGIKYSF